MEAHTIQFFVGKFLRLVLSSGRVYSGKIKEIVKDVVVFESRDGSNVVIDVEDIVAIEDLSSIVESYKKNK
jgi:hypothetical protein